MSKSKKLKFLLLIRRKEQIRPKEVQLAGKKSSARVKRISYVFFAVDHPYVMFKSKKLKFLLLIRRKKQIEPKKIQLFGKKSSHMVQLVRVFGKLTTPYVMFECKKNSNIAHQKEEINQTQKNPAIWQKKFTQGLEDFVRDFCC